jgi:ribosome-associated protein
MSDDEFDDEPSKSARKRDAQRLKALGQQLAELNDEQRATLPLPELLAKAIADYRRITAHEAKRRQGQYIGRLMRSFDATELEDALAGIERNSAAARFAHHETERWRDRLIADDAELTAYVAQHPTVDRSQLRALIRAARKRADDPTAFRALFRYLRDQASNHSGGPDASVPPTVT